MSGWGIVEAVLALFLVVVASVVIIRSAGSGPPARPAGYARGGDGAAAGVPDGGGRMLVHNVYPSQGMDEREFAYYSAMRLAAAGAV